MSFPLAWRWRRGLVDIGNLSRVDKLQRLFTLSLHGVFGNFEDSGGVFGVEVVACAFNLH